MYQKTIFAALSLFTLLLGSSTSCHAIGGVISLLNNLCALRNYDVEAGVYGGYLNLKSEELVLGSHDSGVTHELSKLDWTANNVWVLGAKVNLDNPQTRFHILLDGWSKVYAGNGKMVDRDFLDPNDPSHQTDISVHKDTKLNTAYAVDLSCGSDFLYAKKSKACWSLGYLLGIKYSQFDWDAFGGKYNYDNGNRIGEFPSSLKVISYNQKYLIPYVGLQGNWKYDSRLNFIVFGKYTCLGFILCKDRHLLTSVTFTDTFRYARYWVAGIEAVWNCSECISMSLKYSYDQLERATGHTHVHDSGDFFGRSKSAGLENTYQMLTVGVNARF